METKLTATLVILMFYTSFMGPFVLRGLNRQNPPINRPSRRLEYSWQECLAEIIGTIIIGLVFMLCVVIITAFGWLIFLAGLVAVVAIGVGSYFYFTREEEKPLDFQKQQRPRLGDGRPQSLTQKGAKAGSQVVGNVQAGSQVQGGTQGVSKPQQVGSLKKRRRLSKGTEKLPVNTNLVGLLSQAQPKEVVPGQQPEVLTEEQKKEKEALQKKINAYYDRISIAQGLPEMEIKAGANSFGQKATKVIRSVMNTKPEAPKPKSDDEFKIAARDIIDADLEAAEEMMEMLAEMKKKPSTDPVAAFHQPNHIRNAHRKAWLGKCINLVLNEMNNKRMSENTWEKKYENHKEEMDSIEKKVKDKNTPPEEKRKLNERLMQILKQDDSGKSQEQKAQEDGEKMVKLYHQLQVTDAQARSKFFRAYSKATTMTIFRTIKIQLTRMLYESSLNEVQKDEVEKAIVSINETIQQMKEGKARRRS